MILQWSAYLSENDNLQNAVWEYLQNERQFIFTYKKRDVLALLLQVAVLFNLKLCGGVLNPGLGDLPYFLLGNYELN